VSRRRRVRRYPGAGGAFIIGGTSAAALRRAARVGDGWQAVGRDPAEFAATAHACAISPSARSKRAPGSRGPLARV
jgi:alkanesulfonate monooxygenase SsuD/methylene tetrahydromethanopterin reductase-like flavin-dependent oxidoreductase (luciferase family)